jgi:hypothetical protein
MCEKFYFVQCLYSPGGNLQDGPEYLVLILVLVSYAVWTGFIVADVAKVPSALKFQG